MSIEKIFDEGMSKEDGVTALRETIRQKIQEAAKAAIEEKYGTDEDDEDKDEDKDEDEDDEDKDEDKDNVNENEKTPYDRFFDKVLKMWEVESPEELSDEEKKKFYDYIDKNWDSDKEEEVSESEEGNRDALEEAIKVTATRTGGPKRGVDEFTINRMSDLKKLAKSRQYEYMIVKKNNGDETDYTVDPQGNLVEM